MTISQLGAGPTQSQALARFALGLRYEDIPDEVLNIARGHFVDALGIALASSTFDFGDSVLCAAREFGKGGEARAIGSLAPLPPASAALVNGTLAHGLDFDDTHIGAIYHASAPALASALAAGEAAGASGREVLVAFVAALEIGCRLAGAAPGAFHAKGLHPTAICGVFAAAAASARLRGADEKALVAALGLAGSQAGGILEIGESWLKRFHPGWAAHAGLVAEALGRSGFKGPQSVFEGKHGLYASHIGDIPKGELAPSYQLGVEWRIPGIALKPYPCCHFIHGFVDAALALRDQVPLDQIERIDCPLSPALHHMVAEPHEQKIRPTTTYEALFSVQYVVALALVKGRVDLAAFYFEPFDDPKVLEIAARTFCIEDPVSDFPKHFPGEVRVRLKDGRVIQRREHTSLGTPERRLSKEAIDQKFLANASRAVGLAGAERVLATARRLDELVDVRDLVSLCGSKEGKAA